MLPQTHLTMLEQIATIEDIICGTLYALLEVERTLPSLADVVRCQTHPPVLKTVQPVPVNNNTLDKWKLFVRLQMFLLNLQKMKNHLVHLQGNCLKLIPLLRNLIQGTNVPKLKQVLTTAENVVTTLKYLAQIPPDFAVVDELKNDFDCPDLEAKCMNLKYLICNIGPRYAVKVRKTISKFEAQRDQMVTTVKCIKKSQQNDFSCNVLVPADKQQVLKTSYVEAGAKEKSSDTEGIIEPIMMEDGEALSQQKVKVSFNNGKANSKHTFF